MRAGLAIVVVVVLGAHAHAQPDVGFIGGRTAPILAIDDCRQADPSLTPEQLRSRGSEHYQRGVTLYIQGDYPGAVSELVAAYCLIPYYTILKDIGQAYERRLEYEQAIAYLSRYVAAVPADAKATTACEPPPQEDKANVLRRISVLSNLTAKVYVETTPPDTKITLANDGGTKAFGTARKQIDVLGGSYQMTVERDGFEPHTQTIDVSIGKPYTTYVQLEPLKGTLSVQVTPPDARLFIGKLYVAVGSYTTTLPSGKYRITAESPGRVRAELELEVLPGKIRRELIELAPIPQTGRRQLVVAAAIAGGFAAGGLLFAFDQTDQAEISTAGGVLGVAAGLAGAYFQVPRDLPLGTSNMTITSTVAGAVAGYFGARIFTDQDKFIQPAFGASILLGGAVGYIAADRMKISPGDAAMFNSSVLWGTTAGSLFAISFDPPRPVSSGLVLSGLGMGVVGGVLLTRYYDLSRNHALLIDIGGLVGVVGGLAVASVASETRTQERLANYSLGGMAVGLIGAGILTRNMDLPTIPVTPSVGAATSSDGKTTTTYGFTATW